MNVIGFGVIIIKVDMQKLTHLNEKSQPKIVDISEKSISKRIATAQSTIFLPDEIINELEKIDFQTKKGPVYQTAILAGIMAAKRTSELIPLCHPLFIENCNVSIEMNANKELIIQCTVTVSAKTGVEMEALTGATIAALTIYDMCKALSHEIVIRETKLLKKSGGKSDFK